MGERGGSPLPDGYKAVEYIKTEGLAMIVSDVVAGDLESFDIKVKLYKPIGDSYLSGCFFGNQARVNTNAGSLIFAASRGRLSVSGGISVSGTLPLIIVGEMNRFQYNKTDSLFIVNEQSFATTLGSINENIYLNIGARDYNSSTDTMVTAIGAEFYEIKLNGVDYIPVKKENEVGLLNMSTLEFFKSVTNVPFIASDL